MYNDDQIASPEIIEKMARAYKKESKYNNEEMILATVKRQSKKSLFKDGGNVFNWLVDCIKILDFIIGKNKKELKFIKIKEEILRNKFLFESYFGDKKWNTNIESFAIGLNTAMKDLFEKLLKINIALVEISEDDEIKIIQKNLLTVMEKLI